MKDIYYLTSTGQRIDLIGSSSVYRMLSPTTLFDYSWTEITQGLNFQSIVTMKKEMVSPPFKIRVKGSTKQDFLNNLEALISAFDNDVYRNEMGRLYVGDYYRPCFIKSGTMEKVWERKSTTIEFVAISDKPDWVTWKESEFSGAGQYYSSNIAGTTIFTINRDYRSYNQYMNEDGTVDISWVTGIGAQILMDFGAILEIIETTDIVIYNQNSYAVNLVTQVSNDGENWNTIEDYSIPANMSHPWNISNVTTRYVRFICSTPNTNAIFTIQARNLAITANLAPEADELLNLSNMILDNVVATGGGPYYVAEGTGYMYLNVDIRELMLINLGFIAIPSGSSPFEVQYHDSEGWHTIGSFTGTNYYSWQGHQVCDDVRFKLKQGYTYFNPSHIKGLERKIITNNSYAPSEAIINIYGPKNQASIIIDNDVYGAEIELLAEEWLEVNTKEKTVRHYTAENEYDNAYDNRFESTFNALPAGEHEVTWEGNISKVEIKLEEGRSQPKWN